MFDIGSIFHLGALAWLLDFSIRLAALMFIPRNRRPSSAMAWLLAIFLIPYIGIFLFLVIGNTKLPKKRRIKQLEIDNHFKDILFQDKRFNKFIVPAEALDKYAPIARLNTQLGTLPVIEGNSGELISDYNGSIHAIAKDIDAARHFVHIEYYILSADSKTEVFIRSIEHAVKRGVKVRILIDHLGPRGIPTRKSTIKRLKASGAEVVLMLPVMPLKGKYQRPDLRNHRKIVVIDGHIAYAGSQNLVDRSYLKKSNLKRGLQWQELVIRLEGPIAALSYEPIFVADWYSETDALLYRINNSELDQPVKRAGSLRCQVLPSGPGFENDNNLKLFSSLLYAAKEKAIITSPYFVPDEVMASAVTAAAERGVEVVLFVSEIGDQFMVFNAQRSYYEQLLRAGVKIYAYKKPYILHAKHISIDNDVCVIGSSNMDIRSFQLDLETSLVIYDKSMVREMRKVEDMYIKNSKQITLNAWLKRSYKSQFYESVTRLTSALQ